MKRLLPLTVVVSTLTLLAWLFQDGKSESQSSLAPVNSPSTARPATPEIAKIEEAPSSQARTEIERSPVSSFSAWIDPGIVPVSTPEGALLNSDGRQLLAFRAGQEFALAPLETPELTVSLSRPGWRATPDEFRVPAEEYAAASANFATLLSPTSIYRVTVVDERTEAAIEELTITANYRQSDATWDTFAELGQHHSGPDGSFHLGGIPIDEGVASFSFAAPGYFGCRTDWLPVESETVIDDLVVVMRPDDRSDGTLTGRVLGRGQPLPSTDIEVYRVQERDASRLVVNDSGASLATLDLAEDDPVRRVIQAGADGVFSIELRPGWYRLMVSHGSHAPSLSDPIEVPSSARIHHDLLLEHGTEVHGRILISPDDAHLINSELRIAIEGQDVDYHPLVNAQGEFHAKWLADGYYHAVVRGGTGIQDRLCATSFRVNGQDDLELEVPCGSLQDGVTIEGRIERPADCEGFIWSAGTVPADMPVLSEFRSTTLDADGRFRFHGLPKGPIQIGVVGWEGPEGSVSFGNAPRRLISWSTVDTTTTHSEVCEVHLEFEPTSLIIHCEGESRASISLSIESSQPSLQFGAVAAQLCRVPWLHPGESVQIDGLVPGRYRLTGPEINREFEADSVTTLRVHVP